MRRFAFVTRCALLLLCLLWLGCVDGIPPPIVGPEPKLTGSDPPEGSIIQPTSTKIAFVSARDGDKEIYVMNANGTNQENLTKNPANEGEPSWSPDGTLIAFMSTRDGNWEIYVMDADGKNPVRLTNNPANDCYPSWSPMLLFLSSKGKLATTWGRIKGDFVR